MTDLPVDLPDGEDDLLDLLHISDVRRSRAATELEYRATESKHIRAKLRRLRVGSTKIRVTDHAIVRYLERSIGMDMKALKEEIISKIPKDFEWSDDKLSIKPIGQGDLQYIIQDKMIISVCPTDREKEHETSSQT